MCHSLSLDWNSFCLLEALSLMRSLRQIIIAFFFFRIAACCSTAETWQTDESERRTGPTSLFTQWYPHFFFFLFSCFMSPVPTRPDPPPSGSVISQCTSGLVLSQQTFRCTPLNPSAQTSGAGQPHNVASQPGSCWNSTPSCLAASHSFTHTYTPFSTPVRVLCISMHDTSLCTTKGSDWRLWMHTSCDEYHLPGSNSLYLPNRCEIVCDSIWEV